MHTPITYVMNCKVGGILINVGPFMTSDKFIPQPSNLGVTEAVIPSQPRNNVNLMGQLGFVTLNERNIKTSNYLTGLALLH